MPEIVVVSTEPQRVVVREVSAPDTIKVVAVGPQGPVGTVNPLMFVLRDEAQASAGAAALSEAAAGASEQAAASSETNAAASEASALASQNAASSSAFSAAASANAALASEQAADGSEANAMAYAISAASSASAASGSATAASASELSAAQSAADAAASAAIAADASPVQSVAGRVGDVVLTKDDVGLNNVDNTADGTKVVFSASRLTGARTLSVTGDATGSTPVDWSGNHSIALTLANSGVAAGAYNNSATAVIPFIVDAKGRVTGIGAPVTITPAFASITSKPTTLAGYGIADAIPMSARGASNGVASLDADGLIPLTQLPSYVDDVLEFANLAAFPAVGAQGKIYVALDTNKTYRWSGSVYIYITSGAVDSVAGKTGVVTLVKGDVGLGSVDNTSDASKPVSTAQQAALNLKANLASPVLTGIPQAPTAAPGTNTTQIATTAHVFAATSSVLAGISAKADIDSPSFTGIPLVPTAAIGNNTTQASSTAFVLANAVQKDGPTGAAMLPTGTSAQRPVSGVGKLRFNSDTQRFEGNNGVAWGSLGGATGGGNDDAFYENTNTITSDYTITVGKNAMSAGPITVADGATITIPDGSVWTVV